MTANEPNRRRFLARLLAASGALFLASCDRLSGTVWFPKLLKSGEKLSQATQHLVTSRHSMAQEFTEADLSPTFRSNGTANPDDERYQFLAAGEFAAYRLKVFGLVEQPATFSLDELRALPARSQITRHDCVEGWSAIGKWKGAPLSALLARVHPRPEARYVVFYCADPMDAEGTKYYESIDMEDAYHPQTILAYELNGKPLPIANGAPLRVRVERQLGYKMAKYIMGIELVSSFESIGEGKGGYWEDQGYEWYAGI
ncbi:MULTISPECIES: molybdopterin-binding protein [unclassified Cupriavidus]|uniref:molybdopterin-binding protein n=1 Tax=unclassified Cupriavidus TaxID=2640874 RepID=UPI0010F69FDC|nr:MULTISPECIES: molybdopterin-binding protein [unclassified Cupriavidus]MWL92198.1 molybdopterin-dependent oxidoreductase [Cupriavidus sp. SW-Y-13]